MKVFQRDGAWWIDYCYRGRRHREKIGPDPDKAAEELVRRKIQIKDGTFIPPRERRRAEAAKRLQEEEASPRVLFGDFVVEDFTPWSKAEHSARHHQRLQGIIRKHLMPRFGRLFLQDITPKLVDDYKTMRRRHGCLGTRELRPVSEATINRELCCLKILFKQALQWGKVEANPTTRVKMFRETPKVPRLLEPEEVLKLLEEMPAHLVALVACAVYAGLRRSELFHLRWEDIDWKAGELEVASTREHHTKNYTSRRIPMSPDLIRALQQHPKGLPYVFGNAKGEPFDNIKRSLQSAASRAGIKGNVGLHQLRHAFCSHALMQGIDAPTVQKWMGHHSLTTTLRYTHVSPDHEKATMQRFTYGTWHLDGTSAEVQ